MPKYKFIQREFHQVVVEYYEEFDADDIDKWQEALRRTKQLEEDTSEISFKEVPKNLKDWFDVYKSISPDELDGKDEIWTSANRGEYEIEVILEDENGNIIEKDE